MSVTDIRSGILVTKDFDAAPNADGFAGYGYEEFIPYFANVLLTKKDCHDAEKLVFLGEKMLPTDECGSYASALQFCKEEDFYKEDQRVKTVLLADIEDVTIA